MPLRVPFGVVPDPSSVPSEFSAAHALALAYAALAGKDPGAAADLDTLWGKLRAEARSGGQLAVTTPRMQVAVPRILTISAAGQLSVPKPAIDASNMPLQVIDVGRTVLVVPVATKEHVLAAPPTADLAKVQGARTTAGILYAQTQYTPYTKLLGRLWGDAEPLTALAAAAYHHVTNGGIRATYPRTRIVGELVDRGDERAEITVEVAKAGDQPRITGLYVGGRVVDAA